MASGCNSSVSPEWLVTTKIITLSQLLTIEKSRVRLAPEGTYKNKFFAISFAIFFLLCVDFVISNIIIAQAKRVGGVGDS